MSKDNDYDDDLLCEAIALEQQSALEAGTIGYMARILTQATLPHKKVNDNSFTRENGNFSLAIMAHPKVGLPYGSIPRLLLSWITTEALRTKSPVLELGHTLSAFMAELGLARRGGARGDITRFKNQTIRLFSSTISCIYKDERNTSGVNINIAKQYDLWWDTKSPEQPLLWQSTVVLGDDFFNEITDRPIPLDMRALKALKQSPMALDIYTWLTYRMSYLTSPTEIRWALLQLQFGADYPSTGQGQRDFKKKFLKHLKSVQTIYPEVNLEEGNKGLILLPSSPHVPKVLPPSSPRLRRIEAPKSNFMPLEEFRAYAIGQIILKPDTYHTARKYAVGWDIRYLENEWRDWLAKSNKPLPRNPDGAFIGFCKQKGPHKSY